MKSKIELRQFAVNTALNAEGVTAENFFEFAKKVEEYVLGESELPEIFDEALQTMKLAEIFSKTSTPQTPSFPSILENQNDNKEDETDKEATPGAETEADAKADAE